MSPFLLVYVVRYPRLPREGNPHTLLGDVFQWVGMDSRDALETLGGALEGQRHETHGWFVSSDLLCAWQIGVPRRFPHSFACTEHPCPNSARTFVMRFAP